MNGLTTAHLAVSRLTKISRLTKTPWGSQNLNGKQISFRILSSYSIKPGAHRITHKGLWKYLICESICTCVKLLKLTGLNDQSWRPQTWHFSDSMTSGCFSILLAKVAGGTEYRSRAQNSSSKSFFLCSLSCSVHLSTWITHQVNYFLNMNQQTQSNQI